MRQEKMTSLYDNAGRRSTALYLLLAGAFVLAAPTPGQAAEAADAGASSMGLEEITVTARRREERLQETPIAITAFTANELDRRSLTNLAEVGAFVPNVVMSTAPGGSGGGSNLQIYIRGIGQQDFLFTTDPGVGIYIDGVYLPRSLGGVLDLLDLERIEVLRGPQGTLFGKNTIGGAISVTSTKPSQETSGHAEATIGSYNRLDARGSFNVAINDRLFAKASVSSKDRDGYGKRLEYGTDELIDRAGNENQAAGRLALRWIASETVTVDLSADYTREREESVPTALMEFDVTARGQSPVPFLWNLLVGSPYPMSTDFITDDPFVTYATGPNHSDLDAWGVSMAVDWKISESIGFKSITAYREMDALFGRDGDGSPNAYVHTDQVQDQTQISQEFQLDGVGADDRLKWVVGVFYFDEFGRDHNDVRLASGLFDALEALPGPLDGSPLANPTAPGGPGNPINPALDLDFTINNEIDIKSYAAFGQASYDLTTQLSVTVGARYSYEKKDYRLSHVKVNSGVPIFIGSVGDTWKSFTPMGSIDYKWTEDLLTYASVSRGFKSGGFNGRPINEGSVSAYDPEYVTAFEVGVKSDWLNRRLRVNISAFYNDYTDIQLTAVSVDDLGALQLIASNAGDAEVKGVEAEITAKPAEGLDISGGFGYIDFKLKNLDPLVTEVNANTVWPKTPEWTANASIQYAAPVGNVGSLILRGDWSYISKVYQEPTNAESIAQPGYSLFNARITFEHAEGGWEASLFGTNLTDKKYIANGLQALTSFGTTEAFYGRPREWGASVKKKF